MERRTASFSSGVFALVATRLPTGMSPRSSICWPCASRPEKAGVIGCSPVGRPVFEMTIRAKRAFVLGDDPQSNQPAPILSKERAVLQVERLTSAAISST